MLTPEQIEIGTLTDVQEGISLVLPRTNGGDTILAICLNDRKTAIFLNEGRRFHAFDYQENDSSKGVIVRGLSLEIDEASAFDAMSQFAPHGALLRHDDMLSLAVRIQDRSSFGEQAEIPIVSGLTRAPNRMRIGFYRWQLVIGEGDEKRVMRTFTLQPIASRPE